MERQQLEGEMTITDIGLISLRNQEMSREDRHKMLARLAQMILKLVQREGGEISTAVVLDEMTGKLGRSTAEIGRAIDYGEGIGLFRRNIKNEVLTAGKQR